MSINEMMDANCDIFDSDFQGSNLTDIEQDKVIEKMVDLGYSVGMLKDLTRVYFAPTKVSLYRG